MLLKKTLIILSACLLVFLTTNNAYAGFLDDLKKKSEEVKSEINGESGGLFSEEKEGTSNNKTQSENPSKSKYDVVQVRAIQERLNAMGYYQGEPDGKLNKKTRRAIKKFESEHGLAKTGEPSAGLLGRIDMAYTAAGKNIQGATDKLPEPTLASITLAALHFNPKLLDDDATLKNVLLEVHPEYGQDVANEFKWRKNKEKYKQEMLERADSAQLEFEALPWRRGSVSQTRRIELVEYDFDKEAFRARFSIGTARQITPKMLLTGTAEPDSKYETMVNYISVDLDAAEKVDAYFDNKQRNLFPAYKIKVTGIDPSKRSRPSPIVEFVDDRLSLYALKSGGNFASHYKTDYERLLDVKLPAR